MLSWSVLQPHCNLFTLFRTARRDLPSSSSFTSLAAFSPSSRRFLSIILDLSAAALSSALTVQPMAPHARPVFHRRAEKKGESFSADAERMCQRRWSSSCLHRGANATLSGVLAHVIKKSPSLLSSISKIPQNHLGFNWGLLRPCGHARRCLFRIHPCAVRSVSAWWRTRGDCSCRRWRSPEFPHRPPTIVGRYANVTRTTCLDSPIKSWWDAHAVARPEPIKLEDPEAGYEVRRGATRCGAVRAACSGSGGRVFTQFFSGSGHGSGKMAELWRKTFSFIIRMNEVINAQLIFVAHINKYSTLN